MKPRTLYSLCLLAVALMGLLGIIVLETIRPDIDRGLVVQIIEFMGVVGGVFIFLLRQEKKINETADEVKKEVRQTAARHEDAITQKIDTNAAKTEAAVKDCRAAAFAAQAAVLAAQNEKGVGT